MNPRLSLPPVSALLGVPWNSALYCFIELFFNDRFPESKSQFLLNKFAELFQIVQAWDDLCEFGRLSFLKIFTIQTHTSKNFVTASLLNSGSVSSS